MSTEQKEFPFEIREIDAEVSKQIPADFPLDSFVAIGPKGYYFPKMYIEPLKIFYNFEVRPSDIWIFGCPRTGTTLAQEILWLIANDLNYEKAAAEIVDVRFPVFETASSFAEEFKRIQGESQSYSTDITEIAKKWTKPAWESLSETRERRFIKTHFPLSFAPPALLESGCKIVYLARNVKDVCVSNYLLTEAFTCFKMNYDFEDYWRLFRAGIGSGSSSFFDHVKEGWDLRNNDNFLFLFYEEYTENLRKSLVDIAHFLGKTLTEEQLDKLEDHLKIDNFRKNKSVNNDHLRKLGVLKNEDNIFIRKGKSGGWRQYFTEEMAAETDKWTAENLKNTDLKFPQT